ncbi:MAG TPA: AraC family transcriptional regulator [Burkholderiales bacterium]|nr:AraC family transcriptional regulator [Burkholderiales bacterium]
MDALSEMLKVVRLNSGIFLDAEFTAPWCIDSAPGDEDIAQILPNAEQVSIYHLVTEGRFSAKLPGAGPSIEIQAGDLLMFPHADGHLMGSDLHVAPRVVGELVETSPGEGPSRVRHGGGGARTRFVCGYMACDKRACKPLLDALPRMLRVSLRDAPAAEWIEATIRLASAQTHAPSAGGDLLLARLAELLFVEAIREYVRSLPESQRGWLAGLRDPHVGRALALLHANPARGWDVETLAHETGLSRSALGERFASLLGEPPMQYLTGWRMALAAQALSSGSDAVARIAERVGYESEAAFNRAFKREFGTPPAAWRRAARNAPSSRP